ncbi:hypothetical protein HNV12_04810 [Methanococcoides sp. SA1]|nr:hypothetical protein [Methanococcoides sp. SA1]
MKYVLATFSTDSLDEIRAIAEDELNQYTINSGKINDFLRNQELFNVVKLNYQDYQLTSSSYFNNYQKNPHMDGILADTIRTDINRLVLNFLSSFRTFLDHFDRSLKQQYGKDSQIYSSFKQSLSYQYDNSFAYRFLYRLRNYTQHCGMPVHTINFSSESDKTDESKTNHSMNIFLNREKLLAEYDKWKSLATDISKLPEEFEISPLLDKMMESLDKILKLVLCNLDFQKSLFESINYLDSLLKEGEGLCGEICIVGIDEEKSTSDQLTLELLHIPSEQMQKIDIYYLENNILE